MNKEEILAKSREENKGKDIATIETTKSALQAGYLVLGLLAVFVGIVEQLAFGRQLTGILFAVNASLAVTHFFLYVQLRRRLNLLTGALTAFTSLCWLIAWLLQIVKG